MQTVLEDSLIIFDTITEAYIFLDSKFRITFVNKAAETVLEKTRAKLLGKTFWDVYQGSSGTYFEEGYYRRAMAERVIVRFEHYRESPQRWYATTVMPDSNDGIVVQFSDITHHKLVEDALRKSEEKFFKAFQSSPAGMCIVDVDRNSVFLEVNEAFERITGYQRDEIIGRTSTELGLYGDLHDLDESRRRLLADGGYRNLEIRFRKKNGDVIVGLISASPIEIDGALCAIAVGIDVTEHRRAEQKLQESEELYRQLFEVESDAIVLVDYESGQILEANPAFSRLYGYGREELLSMNRIDVSAEPDKTLRSAREMQSFIPLRWHRKKDGSVFPVEISGCYFDLKGRSVFVSAIRDITRRKVMEEALKKSEEKFSKAFHSNPAAIAISDLSSQSYLEVNGTFEALTGYRRDEVVGRDWSEVGLWADPDVRDQSLAQLRKEGSLRNSEFRFRKKSNELGAGLLSADLIEIDGNSCVITTVVDVTERVRLESQLNQAQKLESVGRLAGGVAHDFNNLLTIINGYSDIMLKELHLDDPLYLPAAEISKAGGRAASLTKQLLTFSRNQVTEPRLLNVNTVVNDAERMLQRIIGEDIELAATLDPLSGSVMADPDQILQVIMNLVVNARDAMPDGGKLEISTKQVDVDESTAVPHPDAEPGRYVVITVTDSGIGMDEKTLQSAFDPFFTTKERGKGTGLGLSTAYGIVRQSGGWIDIWSEVGRGSSFKVYLPVTDARPAPEVAASATSKVLHGDETVLLVEDDEKVRQLTETILKAYGYHVLQAANSSEAYTIAAEYLGEIHLLLTDVILSGMNGKVLSEQLQVLRPKIKVLFTSGYSADVITRRGMLDHRVAYIPKPFTPDSLAAKVREVLTGPAPSHEANG